MKNNNQKFSWPCAVIAEQFYGISPKLEVRETDKYGKEIRPKSKGDKYY